MFNSNRRKWGKKKVKIKKKKSNGGTSLVAQWLRICLPMQGTRIRALVREDSHIPWNNRARVPQLLSLHSRAREPQLLKPAHLEPMLRNKRSHHSEKPAHCNEE